MAENQEAVFIRLSVDEQQQGDGTDGCRTDVILPLMGRFGTTMSIFISCSFIWNVDGNNQINSLIPLSETRVPLRASWTLKYQLIPLSRLDVEYEVSASLVAKRLSAKPPLIRDVQKLGESATEKWDLYNWHCLTLSYVKFQHIDGWQKNTVNLYSGDWDEPAVC